MNKFRTWFRKVLILLAPILMGICGECACSGSSDDGTPSKGKVATSENYSLNRAGLGTSFGTMTSSSESYEVNTTIGYTFSEGISASNSYQIVHTIKSDAVVSP